MTPLRRTTWLALLGLATLLLARGAMGQDDDEVPPAETQVLNLSTPPSDGGEDLYFGTQMIDEEEYLKLPEANFSPLVPLTTLPEGYTLRGHKCVENHFYDQGGCGNCWAAAAVQMTAVRRCLKYNDMTRLSIEEHCSCDTTYYGGVTNNGCLGGNHIPALMYTNSKGDTTEACYPYPKHYYPYTAQTCSQKCADGSAKPRYYTGPVYRISGAANMYRELVEVGPFAVSVDLYSDFPPKDKDSVYIKSSTATKRGGHAFVVVGAGTLNGVPYWEIQNTYGKTWNGDGYARIRRGTNEMRIETFAAAAVPSTPPPGWNGGLGVAAAARVGQGRFRPSSVPLWHLMCIPLGRRCALPVLASPRLCRRPSTWSRAHPRGPLPRRLGSLCL